MCKTCTTYQTNSVLSVYAQERQYDPTRTTTLRNSFARDMRRRFRKIRGLIRQAVVDKDVFGLSVQNNEAMPIILTQAVPPRNAFNFPRSGDKVNAFMEWLRQQVDKELLQVGTIPQLGRATEQAWTDLYVADSYKRGVMRSRYEMGKAGFKVPGIAQTGGIDAVMDTPFHMDRVGLLYSRVFEELKGITSAMDTQISRVLSQGMIDGDGPALLARKMNAVISGKGIGDLGITDTLGRFISAERRATVMARTEIIRAHHKGMMQEYRNWEVEGVYVKAEHSTAGDERVCAQCAGLENTEYTLQEAENAIPVHPQCRCIALPMIVNK